MDQIFLALALLAAPLDPAALRDADIVFQSSRSSQSAAVALATRSRYTHMGIVYMRDGEPFVYEAVGPVKLTPLREWIARGENGHVVVKRLATPIDSAALERMKTVGESFAGKPYDLRFGWDDSAIYCSELVYKIFERGAGIEIAKVRAARDFDLSSPEVQRKISERFGESAPFDPDEPVISPRSMFADPGLVTVFED